MVSRKTSGLHNGRWKSHFGGLRGGNGVASPGSRPGKRWRAAHRSLVLYAVVGVALAMLRADTEPQRAAHVAPSNAPPSASNGGDCAAFKSFLVSPLQVRHIHYLMDPSYFRLNGKMISFPVEFEAAIQGDTFYVKQLTDLRNPTSPPGSARIEIWGASRTDFWAMQGLNVTLADKDLSVSGTNTAPQILAEGSRRFLENFLSLGIDGLKRDTLHWTSPWDFRADGRHPGSKIEGRLLSADDGRLRGLVYTYEHPGEAAITCRVFYAYLKTNLPSWMPSRIVRELDLGGGKVNMITNEILECILGPEDLPAEGYTPGRFLPSTPWTNLAVMVFSNHVGWLHHGGRVIQTVLPSELPKIHPSQHKWVRLGFFVVVAVGAFLCIRLCARSQLPGKQRAKSATTLQTL